MENEQLSLFTEEQMNPKGDISITQPKMIAEAEWCFQFFDNEPVVFAFSKSETDSSNLVIELRPTEDDTLTFSHNGMSFKIFPREMTEETRKIREQQNANTNKEA